MLCFSYVSVFLFLKKKELAAKLLVGLLLWTRLRCLYDYHVSLYSHFVHSLEDESLLTVLTLLLVDICGFSVKCFKICCTDCHEM